MAQTMHSVKTIFRKGVVTTGGNPETILDILGFRAAGVIRNVSVTNLSGGGADYEFYISDKVGTSPGVHTVYSNPSLNYNAPNAPGSYFDTRGEITDDDLHITLTPAADGTFDIRIDIEIIM